MKIFGGWRLWNRPNLGEFGILGGGGGAPSGDALYYMDGLTAIALMGGGYIARVSP